MAVSFRKNIAQKVSSVDAPEIFNWSKWIRTPAVKEHTIEAFKVPKPPDVSHLNIWIDFPLFSRLDFQFEKQKLAKKLKKLQIESPKTNFLFFTIAAPRVKNIDTGYKTRTDIIKPYFSIRKPDIGFTHSETAWIKNLIINGVDFLISSPDISYSHSETAWIKNLIINQVDFSSMPAEISFAHSETKWIKELIINNIPLPAATAETMDALVFLEEKEAEVLFVEDIKNLPDIIKVELPKKEIDTAAYYLSEEEKAKTADIDFTLNKVTAAILEIKEEKEETAADTKELSFLFEPTELLPVDVGVNSEIREITDYTFTQPEIEDCISELVPQIFDIDILSAAQFAGPESINENILQYSNFLNISSDILTYELNPQSVITLIEHHNIQNSIIEIGSIPQFEETVTQSEHIKPELPELTNIELLSLFEETDVSLVKIQKFKNPAVSDKKFIIKTPQTKSGNIKFVKYEEPAKPEAVEAKEPPAKPAPAAAKEKPAKPEVIVPKEKSAPVEVIKPQPATVKVEKPKAAEKPAIVEKPVKKEPVILSFKPNIEIRRDFWVDLDEEQKQEYENVISKELHQIEDLVQSGNIFRFQSKVFMFLHQLKQICNFASNKPESLKSQFLMSQLEKIAKENKKAVVFSQYDKHGTQKIEQIFKKNKIKYYTFLSTSTTSEIERNLSGFRGDKNFSILLASSKAATHRKYFGDLSYIIHFDQWWLPTTQWVIEDRAYNLDDKNFRPNQRINILSYNSKVLIEKRIYEKMRADNLNMKSVFESVSSEIINRMITDEDWMNILGIEKKEKQIIRVEENEGKAEAKEEKTETAPKENPIFAIMKRLKAMEAKEVGNKISDLFTRLNLKEVTQQSNSPEEILIKASAQIKEKKILILGKCFLNETLDPKDLQAFIQTTPKENISKIFLFVFGKMTNPVDTEATSDSVILFTLDKLATLLHRMDLM